jgi:hypothetical protein
MPTFKITAHQEMYTKRVVEADSAREAAEKFAAMVECEEVTWEIGDEDLEIEVKDDKGRECGSSYTEYYDPDDE